MTPVQQVVLTLGLILIGLTVLENWRSQIASVI